MASSDRVCPRCGAAAAEHEYCQTCGLHLWDLEELPTRSGWEVQHPFGVSSSSTTEAEGAEASSTSSILGKKWRDVSPRLLVVGAISAVAITAIILAFVLAIKWSDGNGSALGVEEVDTAAGLVEITEDSPGHLHLAAIDRGEALVDEADAMRYRQLVDEIDEVCVEDEEAIADLIVGAVSELESRGLTTTNLTQLETAARLARASKVRGEADCHELFVALVILQSE